MLIISKSCFYFSITCVVCSNQSKKTPMEIIVSMCKGSKDLSLYDYYVFLVFIFIQKYRVEELVASLREGL